MRREFRHTRNALGSFSWNTSWDVGESIELLKRIKILVGGMDGDLLRSLCCVRGITRV